MTDDNTSREQAQDNFDRKQEARDGLELKVNALDTWGFNPTAQEAIHWLHGYRAARSSKTESPLDVLTRINTCLENLESPDAVLSVDQHEWLRREQKWFGRVTRKIQSRNQQNAQNAHQHISEQESEDVDGEE